MAVASEIAGLSADIGEARASSPNIWELASLRSAEQFLIWALRRMMLQRGPCPLLAREFTLLCGDEGPEALVAYHTLVRFLARNGRHRLAVGELALPRLTRDERQLLSLLAAVQASDAIRAEAHLRWLTATPMRQRIEAAARLAGDIFARHGQLFALPESEMVQLAGNDPCMTRVH